jgi:hypothetical protein
MNRENRPSTHPDNMLLDEVNIREWIAAEHHRIHVMELWPEGPRKEAGLAAARCALESLAFTRAGYSFKCVTCAGRREPVAMISFAPGPQRLPSGRAA